MKLLVPILIAFATCWHLTSNAKQEVVTEVNAAIVYTQGAQLKRFKKINLKKGENIIRFTDLERTINANSIQLFGRQGNSGFTVVYTQFSQENKKIEGLDKKNKMFQDSLLFLGREIDITKYKIQNLTKEKELIHNHNRIEGQAENTFVSRLGELADFYRSRLDQIDQKLHDLQIKKFNLNELSNAVRARQSNVTSVGQMGVIEAKIYAQKDLQASIELNYLVQQVNWTPFYEIKSAGFGKPLKTVCKGTVNQNTGVAWDNVKLTLSTKKPEVLTEVPKVHPWVLYFQNKRNNYTNSNQLIYSGAISNSSVPLSAASTITPNSSNTANYLDQFKHATHKMINKEYDSNIKFDVSGQQGVAIMVLEEFEMEAEYVYYAVPKYNPNVFLLAQIAKWKQYDLIPAYSTIFIGGSYVGKVFLDPTKAEDNLQMMLGKERGINVERRKINQYSEKKIKLSGGIETTEIGIEIIVHNNLGKEVDLVIKDQVPIVNAGETEIEVNVKNISKAKKNQKTGTLTWAYKLKPQKFNKHEIIYEVKKPKGKFIGNF
jgi:uncharacterized protein (TIGR02231 family)